MKKVLFIHHGGIAGGAPLSMLYTMKGIKKFGFEPVVGLKHPMPELHQLYNKEGFVTHELPWLVTLSTHRSSEGKRYNPYVWLSLIRILKNWNKSKKRLTEFVKDQKIGLVHLNSVILSNAASALLEINFPLVWHVREFGPLGRNNRYRFIRKKLIEAKNLIFLSKAEKRSWIGDNKEGIVVANFVDLKYFDYKLQFPERKKYLNIKKNEVVILYVGGLKDYKGVIPLIKALGFLKEKSNLQFKCLMPDSNISSTKIGKTIDRLLDSQGVRDNCILMPFNPEIRDLYSICDLLVFPALNPHFARPIIEAYAMKKPVVATDLEVVNELVLNCETGFLVQPNDHKELASKIMMLMNDSELRTKMGEVGFSFVQSHHSLETQVKKIADLYYSILE